MGENYTRYIFRLDSKMSGAFGNAAVYILIEEETSCYLQSDYVEVLKKKTFFFALPLISILKNIS